ncbi:MAG: aminopeptidase, partial [Chloroflexota bacterium]|nr:aminopeptidase [Chloroflexota bacterium]
MTDPRISKLAHLLVDYSTGVQHDDEVLIWAPGSTTSMPLLLAIYERVLERGGHPHIAPYLRGDEDI